jgi:hypothetical protein
MNLPFRLLSVGMLLTMLLGAVLRGQCFATSPFGSGNPRSILARPMLVLDNSLRKTCVCRCASLNTNIEAGLNDGLCVPFLQFFILSQQPAPKQQRKLTRFIFEQLELDVLIGVNWTLGGTLLDVARRKSR